MELFCTRRRDPALLTASGCAEAQPISFDYRTRMTIILLQECSAQAILYIAEGMDHVESVPLDNSSPLPPPPRLACASG